MSNENNEDSSDSEADGSIYESDDDAELSFESDDEGNFLPNPLKKRAEPADSDSAEDVEDDSDASGDDEEDEYEDGEEEEDVEDIEDIDDDEADEADSDEEVVDSDDSASETEKVAVENGPVKQKTVQNGTTSHIKAKKSVQPKTNGIGGSNADDKADSEVGKLLRIKPSTSTGPNAVEAFKNELNKPDKKKGKSTIEKDEYAQDSSDEEDIRNTVGNIPMEWYDQYKHIGYDWDAKQIIKPPKRDQLDDFLKRMEDPNFWRTVKDPQTGQDVILSEADIELIKRINEKRIPDGNYEEYAVSTFGFLSQLPIGRSDFE